MREVGPGAYAGYLVGGTGACPPVSGAGPCPSDGQGCDKECVLGSYELSMTLGSLSADGWGCVPVLLVVWSEAFQLCSL